MPGVRENHMPKVILPDRRLIRHPDISLFPARAARLADGAFAIARPDLVEIIFYCERDNQAVLSGAHAMSRNAFLQSLLAAAAEFLPDMMVGPTLH